MSSTVIIPSGTNTSHTSINLTHLVLPFPPLPTSSTANVGNQKTTSFLDAGVVALERLIHRNLERLCARMSHFRDAKIVFPVNAAMLCFTNDVVSEYAFGPQYSYRHSYNLLGLEDFAPSLLAANKKAAECSYTMIQFPFWELYSTGYRWLV